MKREYTAHECALFSAEIDEMLSINNSDLEKRKKDKQLEITAKRILAKNRVFTGGMTPPVALFYQLKNWKRGEEKLREVWINEGGQSHDHGVMKALNLHEPGINIEHLPECSWMLTIEFTLASSYTSSDDNPFYMLENPLRREKVFKVPYIASSQWKGMLRASLSLRLAEMAEQLGPMDFARQRFFLTILFGDEKGEVKGSFPGSPEDEGKCSNLAGFLDKACDGAKLFYRKMVRNRFNLREDAEIPSSKGNLYFYPTYFNNTKTSFEIINPHSRASGAGTVPFYLETLPAGTVGRMTILYAPLYATSFGEPDGDALEYLKLVTQGLSDLFVYYGLGAKTSTGFGVINTEEKVEGTFLFNSQIAKKVSGESEQGEGMPESFQDFFEENGQIKKIFLTPDGEFYSNKGYRSISDKTGVSQNIYKRFRDWYREHGETEKEGDEQLEGMICHRFSSLQEMLDLPFKLLRKEGEVI